MYTSLLRPLLFKLAPEVAHQLTLTSLNLLQQLGMNRILAPQEMIIPKTVMGIEFKNPIGLAAGLDKNGDYIDALASLGFGFIEIGTLTPKAQIGNPKPRLFRIPKAEALINRMGFNNHGIDYAIERIKTTKYNGVLGINIGKNASTPLENAADDYLTCLHKAYPYASYITVNISSPNTAGLRDLQHGAFLQDLLKRLKKAQQDLAIQHQKHVPLVVKVAPDLNHAEIIALADTLIAFNIEGLISTNTSTDHSSVAAYKESKEAGGLSGLPIATKSTEVLRLFQQELRGRVPLIASGGIMNAKIAQDKLNAGADLIQIYTGLIYQGPKLINACAKLFNS